MGRLRNPLRFVCRGCGKDAETYSSSNRGIYCSKQCRADYERKGRDAPRRYKQDGYWMLAWTVAGGTKNRPKRRFQFEHRRVWEDEHGPIPRGYVIHHVNGDKLDNRLANLSCMHRADHARHHAVERWSKVAE